MHQGFKAMVKTLVQRSQHIALRYLCTSQVRIYSSFVIFLLCLALRFWKVPSMNTKWIGKCTHVFTSYRV